MQIFTVNLQCILQPLQLYVVARNGWSDISGCSLINVVITRNEEVIISPNSTVLGVQFERSNVFAIPNAIFKAFPNLEVFDVENSGLEILEVSNFEGANNLVSFYARNNKIKHLDADIFKHAPKMQIVLVSYNQIEVVSRYFFNGATNISEAYLNGNNISSISFETFKELSALRLLDLQKNTCIDQIFYNVKDNFAKLKREFQNSSCSEIVDEQFDLREKLIDVVGTNLLLTNQQLRQVKDSEDIISNSTKILLDKVEALEDKEELRNLNAKDTLVYQAKFLEKLILIFESSIKQLKNNN